MPEFSFTAVESAVRAAGVPAVFDHSGGGCVTMYVGEPTDVETTATWNGQPVTDRRYTLLMGPGSWRGTNGNDSVGHTEDCYIGPDDDGESDPFTVPVEFTAADIAAQIVRQYRAATAPATPADPADRFVCDSPSVVDRPDFTTRGELDNPRGGWVAEFVPADGTYRVSYPAMSGRVRVYRPVAADSPATSS